eukprot:Clim_evm11s239 gene=Clim_evmTU11s239
MRLNVSQGAVLLLAGGLSSATILPEPVCRSKPSVDVWKDVTGAPVHVTLPETENDVLPRDQDFHGTEVYYVSTEEIERFVESAAALGSTFVSLILFFSSSCPHSYEFAPDYERLSAIYPQIPMLSTDVHGDGSLAAHNFAVASFPVMYLFRGDKPRDIYHGDRTLESIDEWLSSHVEYKKSLSLKAAKMLMIEQPWEPSNAPNMIFYCATAYFTVELVWLCRRRIAAFVYAFKNLIPGLKPNIVHDGDALRPGQSSHIKND